MNALMLFLTKMPIAGYFVAVITLFTRMGLFMSLQFLSIYLTKHNLFSPSEIGVIIGTSGLFFCLFGLVNGVLIDKYASKILFVISLILTGFCYFALALSMHIFVVLVLVNGVLGWLRSIIETGSMSVAVNHTSDEYLGNVYSARFIALNLGLVLGPVLGATFAGNNSLIIFYLAGLAHILLGLGLLLFRIKLFSRKATPTLNHIRSDFMSFIKNRNLAGITLINCLIWMLVSQLDSTIPQIITQTVDHPAQLMSQLLVVNATICIFFQYPVTNWSEKQSISKCGIFGCVLFSLSYILLAYSFSTFVAILGIAFFGFAQLFTWSLNNLLILRITPKIKIGTYSGIANLSLLGLFIGPVLGGISLQYLGSFLTLIAMGVFALMIGLAYLVLIPDKIDI